MGSTTSCYSPMVRKHARLGTVTSTAPGSPTNAATLHRNALEDPQAYRHDSLGELVEGRGDIIAEESVVEMDVETIDGTVLEYDLSGLDESKICPHHDMLAFESIIGSFELLIGWEVRMISIGIA